MQVAVWGTSVYCIYNVYRPTYTFEKAEQRGLALCRYMSSQFHVSSFFLYAVLLFDAIKKN